MFELPRNAGYLIAAYAIAAWIFLVYYLRLRRKMGRGDRDGQDGRDGRDGPESVR
jgi:hypothetical protein